RRALETTPITVIWTRSSVTTCPRTWGSLENDVAYSASAKTATFSSSPAGRRPAMGRVAVMLQKSLVTAATRTLDAAAPTASVWSYDWYAINLVSVDPRSLPP